MITKKVHKRYDLRESIDSTKNTAKAIESIIIVKRYKLET
jgi:hypothetical protein